MFPLLVILIKYQLSTSLSTTLMQVDLLSNGDWVVKLKVWAWAI